MALAKLKNRIGIEEYIEGEEVSEIRHEYIYGEVYAMAGTSDRHNRIAMNIGYKIDNHLGNSRCEAFIESVKLKADAATFYYPDVMVACDETPESVYYREEPILLVEVLSPSTARTDRHEKLTVYKNIPSLQEYLIVWQDKIYIELHQRQADNLWQTFVFDETQIDEEIELISVDMKMRVDEIYRRVKFENQ
jgi:Uma2 family endonuclease